MNLDMIQVNMGYDFDQVENVKLEMSRSNPCSGFKIPVPDFKSGTGTGPKN